nr:hypothetical protein 19 [bacterium]
MNQKHYNSENKVPYRSEVIDWDLLPNFEPWEFDDPDVPGSWVHMDPLTILELQRIRKETGWKIITHNKFGLSGCVCVRPEGHSKKSRHYVEHPDGCSAVDWHFETDAEPRMQAEVVRQSNFKGFGVYYDWQWKGEILPVGFHTDRRRIPQYWRRENGRYIYLLK